MRKKLILLNFITIFLLIAVLTGLGNVFYRRSMEQDRLLYMTELQRQLSNSFAIKIQSVERSMELLAGNESVKHWLHPGSDYDMQDEKFVRDLFLYYESLYPEYLNMVLVAADGKKYLSNDSYRMVNDSFAEEPWFYETMQRDSGFFYEFYNAARNLQSWKTYDNQSYISIAKAIESDTERIGVLLMDVSLQDLKALYRDLEPDSNNFFFLMDDKGNVLLSPSNRIVYRIKPEWFGQDSEGIISASILGNLYHLVYHQFENKRFTIVGVYDVARQNSALFSIFKANILVAVFVFVLALLLSAYFMDRFTKPLRRLAELMKLASKGNLDVRFAEPCDNEVQDLGNAFNTMTVKIKSLLRLVYKEQKQKREAEMQVMQEQIKPHFLYNTLDMIAWMARKHGAGEIIHVIERMSSFFRTSLSKGKELISLREELSMVSSYLDIQSMRYQNLFVYRIDCDEDTGSALIPRMCLQPLVENCLYHGIKESDNEQSVLQITASKIPGGIRIIVEDNGKGIDDELMERLNESLRSNNWEDWTGGFGVKNIGRRLWHTFAKGSGLQYKKTAEGFTQAQLDILYKEVE